MYSLLFLGALMLLPVDGLARQLELRPNLRALPAADLAIQGTFDGGQELRLSVTTWNAGLGRLLLVAGETGQGQGGGHQNVYQDVLLDNGTSYQRLAGVFEWHEFHLHFHFGDYADYRLEAVDAPGNSVRESSKTTFCIMDTDRIDRRLENAAKRAVFTTCGDQMQGMSVGWGDTYGSHLVGQSIDITGMPAGLYRLIIEADPKDLILETNDDDNVACSLIDLNPAAFSVTVVDANSCDGAPGGGGGGGGGEEVALAGISPNWANVGTVTGVTITGSGFTNGMGVFLEGGAGPSPSLSDVQVVDSNTITANVTVRNGGPNRPRTWDLRVESAVLPGAFTVIP